jgi:imidazolonepropionase-like amidohydrolase
MKRVALALLLLAAPLGAQDDSAVLHVRQVIDGRGGVLNNAFITVRGGRIAAVTFKDPGVTIDLGNLTLLPGFIDTHVHIGWHFDDKGRYHSGPEPLEQAA